LRGAFLLLGRGRLSVLRPNFIAEHARILEPAGLPGISFGRKQPKLAIVKVLPYATIMGHGRHALFLRYALPFPHEGQGSDIRSFLCPGVSGAQC
jgi:hypothetical protein